MEISKIKNRGLVIFILGLLSTIGPFSIDMYLPGFPVIAEGLHTTVGMVQYSLSSYFIGICVGQLICGPLLDRFGRKAPLYVGIGLYMLASVGCAFSISVEMLIGFRFLQALGGCVGLVAPRAVVRDLFPVSEAPKVFSMLMLILSVSPILAPTAGSYVIAAMGWPAVFVILALIAALVITATGFWLPESRPPDPTFSLRAGPIYRNYASVLQDRQFLSYSTATAMVSAGLYAYIAGSSAVCIQLFGITEHQYGQVFAGMAIGLIGCAQLNTVLLKRFSSPQIMRTVMLVQAGIGLALATGTVAGVLGLYGTLGLIFPFLCCQGFIGPNGSAMAMAPFARQAGSASAMLGAIQMGLGAMASALVGLLNNGTALPMVAVMAGCSLTGMLLLRLNKAEPEAKPSALETEQQEFEMIEKF